MRDLVEREVRALELDAILEGPRGRDSRLLLSRATVRGSAATIEVVRFARRLVGTVELRFDEVRVNRAPGFARDASR